MSNQVVSTLASQANIFLYGPPGSGKSEVGQILAGSLDLPFFDLDRLIEHTSGQKVAQIFAAEGEAGFRVHERAALEEVITRGPSVVSLGGGALLDQRSRTLAEENGRVICFSAPLEILLQRLEASAVERPLLAGDGAQKLQELLNRRAGHYAAFSQQLETGRLTPQEAAWEAQLLLGFFRVGGMGEGYPVQVITGGARSAGKILRGQGLKGPLALVSDQNVSRLYGRAARQAFEEAGYAVKMAFFPAGEQYKTIQTITQLWEDFLQAGLERGSTVVTMGGGVVGDIGGFAAATYLRGVPWFAIPTTLLAMVDASLGGKSGIDLPQGKNLVGSFHPPSFVLIDPSFLSTLPEPELRAGMAEVVKHGIIGDTRLFQLCSLGWEALQDNLETIVRRAIGVKLRIVQSDPYEKGLRKTLNYGHTLGHAIETASNYSLRHGEAVAIGMAAEARLGERLGLSEHGLSETIVSALRALGLPTEIPASIDRIKLAEIMQVDKKKTIGILHFALPVRIGKVEVVQVEDFQGLLDQGS